MRKILKMFSTKARKLNLWTDWLIDNDPDNEWGCIMSKTFRGSRAQVKLLGIFWIDIK